MASLPRSRVWVERATRSTRSLTRCSTTSPRTASGMTSSWRSRATTLPCGVRHAPRSRRPVRRSP
eukprot:2841798-Heterocapsa_arctica.AAC.1